MVESKETPLLLCVSYFLWMMCLERAKPRCLEYSSHCPWAASFSLGVLNSVWKWHFYVTKTTLLLLFLLFFELHFSILSFCERKNAMLFLYLFTFHIYGFMNTVVICITHAIICLKLSIFICVIVLGCWLMGEFPK